MDDFHYAVVHRGREAHFATIFRYGTIDGIDFREFAFLQILQHAGLQLGMFTDGDRDDEEREGTLQGIVVVEQLHDVLALYRFDADTAYATNINTFLDQRLHDATGIAWSRCFAKGASEDGTHTREGSIDEQFAPTGTEEVFFHLYCSHQFQQFLHLVEMLATVLGDGSQREGEGIGFAGEFAYTRFLEGRSPSHGTSQDSFFPQDFGNLHFRQTVLEGNQYTVRSQVVLEHLYHFGIVLLLGHEEEYIVFSAHLVGRIGYDGLAEVHGSHHLGSLRFQTLYMGLVAVDQLDRHTRLADECSEDSA